MAWQIISPECQTTPLKSYVSVSDETISCTLLPSALFFSSYLSVSHLSPLAFQCPLSPTAAMFYGNDKRDLNLETQQSDSHNFDHLKNKERRGSLLFSFTCNITLV